MRLGLLLWVGLLAGPALAHSPGDRVLAVWAGDGFWYPARVQAAAGDAVQVAFDDGDVAAVPAADVRPLDWHAGSRLQCNWQNRGTYYDGVVAAMDGETIRFEYDDGDRETITLSRCRGNAAASASPRIE
jgi:hypothetical protein